MYYYLSFVLGVCFGIFLISLCRMAKGRIDENDKEAKAYEDRSKQHIKEWNDREIAYKDCD